MEIKNGKSKNVHNIETICVFLFVIQVQGFVPEIQMVIAKKNSWL